MINIKTFVRPNGTVTITCPSCDKSKNVSVSQFRDKKHSLTINCVCKTKFTVELDFRKHYRKEVNLPGTYRIIKPLGGGNGDVQVLNISFSGLGFTFSGMDEIKKGQTVELTFQLDDKKQTKLVKQVVACSVSNNYVGSEFTDQDLFEKDLGFYLRF